MSISQPEIRSSPGLEDIHQLIEKCHIVLKSDPSCLHTRAIRGHACMKAKYWDQAIQDFSVILSCQPDDVHGRFSRGMALFKSSRFEDAQKDFSQVLALSPNHIMARYARASCYNSEGEFNQAIQEYTLALHYDEKENAKGFCSEKCKLRLHENAEHLIRKTTRASARPRDIRQSSSSCECRSPSARLKDVTISAPLPCQEIISEIGQMHSKKRQRRVAHFCVNLSEFATTRSSTIPDASFNNSEKQINPTATPIPATNSETRGIVQSQLQQTETPRNVALRGISRTVRRVTVAL